MADAVFGSVELRGVSSAFQAEFYELARQMAAEHGFGRNVIVGGQYVEEELPSDDVISDEETEVSPSFGVCPPVVVVDSDVESVIVLDGDDDELNAIDDAGEAEDSGSMQDAFTMDDAPSFEVLNE